MKNEALARLEPLLGSWDLTLSNAWFLESDEQPASGWATFELLDDTFVVFRWTVGQQPPSVNVIGYSDPREQYYMLYHDDRGVARVFEMEFGDGNWSVLREDADFHQRFVGQVDGDRITLSVDASEDEGQTWRKDFDLVFERKT